MGPLSRRLGLNEIRMQKKNNLASVLDKIDVKLALHIISSKIKRVVHKSYGQKFMILIQAKRLNSVPQMVRGNRDNSIIRE